MKVRFAPSPTGKLHVGNARVALLNWLWARQQGGRFLLRMDDTDQERSTQAFAEGIERDMTWLGLAWDEFARQSDRQACYDLAMEKLKAEGRLYRCYETADELDLKRKLQLKTGRPPQYDRAALNMTDRQAAAFQAEGRQPHWRFKLRHQAIDWDDVVRGAQHFDGGKLSDPVLVREDGRPLYTLSSVVDDIELGVTHILRGEDHVANTAVQIQLFDALGGATPTFAHLPLLTDAGGAGLSKRLGSLSLESLRDDGLEAMALNAYMAHLGTPDAAEVALTLDSLVSHFDIARFGRATPKFDPAELRPINARILHAAGFAAAQEWLAAAGLADFGEDLWDAVHGNLETRQDARFWHQVVRGRITPVIAEEDKDYLAQAAALLPQGDYDQQTWGRWTKAIKDATGRKGKELFLPLRLALTGQAAGPELKLLLPLLGREKAACRLTAGAD